MTVTSSNMATERPVVSRRQPSGEIGATAGLGPLIREAWYVIAASDDVGHELSTITVLNQPLVFFRADDGSPVVLDDRCAHRRYSLAKSHLKGDTIQCAYHGFTYDRTGACIFAPGVTKDLKFGVRQYPAVERGLWLWVWMGDGEADPAEIPLPDVVEKTPYGINGYTLNPCNYYLLHENLLDLTHLHYLHGPMVASEAYANTPANLQKSEDARSVGLAKVAPSVDFVMPALFCGADPQQLVRQEEELWSVGPSLNYTSMEFFLPEGSPATPHRSVVVHAITPESETSTHQFWTVRFDAPLASSKDELVVATQMIFNQDVEVLAIQNNIIAGDTRTGVVENSIPGDVAGLRLRRALQRLAAAERK